MHQSRKNFICLDCKDDTGSGHKNEYYFVKTEIWLSVVPTIKGMLCIGCLEDRLGRRLTKDDFTDAFINSLRYGQKSQRLVDRLTS